MPAFVPATATDVDRLVALMGELYAHDALPFDAPAHRDALVRLLAEPARGRVFLVAADDGAVAGYAVLTLGYSLEFRGIDAFVDELYLSPPYRSRGLGRAALAFLEETSRSLGVSALHLEVARPNRRAQDVYRRAGFVDHDRYLMTKRLPPGDGPPSVG